MKILKVTYMDGEARFIVEGDKSRVTGLVNGKPTIEYNQCVRCIILKGKTTKQQVIDELKTMIQPKDNPEQTYNDLDLQSIQGTDI